MTYEATASGRKDKRLARAARLTAALTALAAAACGPLDSRQLGIRDADAQTGRSDAAAPPAGPHRLLDGATSSTDGSNAPSVPAPDASPPAITPSTDAARDAGSRSSDAALDAPIEAPEAGIDAACHRFEVDHGWVDDWSNCLEIQGAVWDDSDTGSFNRAFYSSDPLCVEDASPETLPAILGINLNQAHLEAEPADYNADLHGVRGFRVSVTTGQLPGQPFPFVGVTTPDGVYCTVLAGVGVHELRLSDLRARCWESNAGPAPNTERLRALVFYYPAGWPGDTLAGCVGEFTAIVE